MAMVTGIGGIFFKSAGKGADLAAWSEKNLGIDFENWGGSKVKAMKRLLLLAALCGIATVSIGAQSSAGNDLWLSRLVGHWVLEGRIAGKDTTDDVDGEWVLNHLYVRLHEVSREKDAKGQPAYEAIIYVTRDAGRGEYAILWLDNTASGAFAAEGTGHAKPDGESLPFLFKDGQGVITFKNTFVYDPANRTWAWVMDNVEKGVPKPFGRVKLRAR